jgi:microsomal epoxide hydrolase
MSAPAPFRIAIPDAEIEAVRARVRAYDWDGLPDAGGWSAGTGLADMRAIAAYWADGYDWRAAERALNRLPHSIAEIDGRKIHYVHLKSAGAGRLPLILSHGWPGSFFEFMHIAETLAHPERFGGDASDGFDVIIPSLPGYGFSGRPPHIVGPRWIAAHFHKLMTETLGYTRYLAQGGDWGSMISTWMAHDHPEACAGLHLNMSFFRLPGVAPTTPEEIANAQAVAKAAAGETAYQQIQGTKPQTLGYALMDSPVGLAAWIIEKFAAWSDLPRDEAGRPRLAARYTHDQLLTNVMIYVVSKCFATSTWLYKGVGEEMRAMSAAPHRIEVPTGFAAFPDPVFPPAPRSMFERTFNLKRYTPMPRGGHFAALEEPDLFVEDVRAFARLVR